MNNRFLSLKGLFVLCCCFWFGSRFASAQAVLDSLPPVDSMSDRTIAEYTRQLTAITRHYDNKLAEQNESAAVRRAGLEENYKSAKADSTTAKSILDSLSALLKTARNEEKRTRNEAAKAGKTLEFAIKSSEADSMVQRKNIRKLWMDVRTLRQLLEPPSSNAPEDGSAVAKPEKKKKPEKPKPSPEAPDIAAPVVKTAPAAKPTAKYDPSADVMLNPPNLPCQMAVNTRDEFSGAVYRQLIALELFRTSPPALKNFLQGRPNVQCEAALAASGSRYYLNLVFHIIDPSPRKAFGKLDKNSEATLTFIDGSVMPLNSLQLSEGVLNPDNQVFTYQSQYLLNEEQVRRMRKSELDQIRIAWSTGYEDYDVQYVQLLMQQARCLFE